MNKYHIKIGDQTYQRVFIENEEIAKIFQGNTLIWEKYLKLILTLDPNSGQLVDNDPQYELTCGFEFPIVINDPSKTNYTFLEWNSKKDGSGDKLILEGIVPFENDLTAYAKWIESICTVTYVANCFGITPDIITTIKETGEVITKTTQLGINTLSFQTYTNKNATISTNAPENTIIIFIKPDGTVLRQREYSYITDNITMNFRMQLINAIYDFAYINDKIHEDRFIQTSGSLIGGFKYKFHYHINGQTADEGWGKISVGHVGGMSSHVVHLSFGYQIEGQAITKVEFEYNADDATKIVGGKKTGKVKELQVTNLSSTSTYIQVKDFIIDLTGYSVDTIVNIGIVLRDDSSSCGGIYFGIKGKTTTCTLEIVE